jgi:hypothetical protein
VRLRLVGEVGVDSRDRLEYVGRFASDGERLGFERDVSDSIEDIVQAVELDDGGQLGRLFDRGEDLPSAAAPAVDATRFRLVV